MTVLCILATKGFTTQIDECDFDLVENYNVYAQPTKEGGAYIVTQKGRGDRNYLHRRI